MKIRIKSVKSKIIVFFIGLAAFQICVMAGFAKLQLEPSIVSMYSEHLERFADVALTETTQETEKIERYMVNIIGECFHMKICQHSKLQEEENYDKNSNDNSISRDGRR